MIVSLNSYAVEIMIKLCYERKLNVLHAIHAQFLYKDGVLFLIYDDEILLNKKIMSFLFQKKI